jgi:four helix bundle protein
MNQGRLSVEFRERTKNFASTVIRLFVALPKEREEVRILGKQLLRSGTSVAAHVREACRARSDAEFCSKLEGALQEADESQLWLELLRDDCQINAGAVDPIHREADELIAIMVAMVSNTKQKDESRKMKTISLLLVLLSAFCFLFSQFFL